MDLSAVDLERFKACESVPWSIAVRIAEIEAHQNNSRFFVDGGNPIAHVRMGDDTLRSNVLTSGASAGPRHDAPIFDTIRIGSERSLDCIEGASDFQSCRVELRNPNQIRTRHALRGIRHDVHC